MSETIEIKIGVQVPIDVSESKNLDNYNGNKL